MINNKAFSSPSEIKIGVIGLGYVGLPLAVEFSKFHSVIGFDIDKDRISELNKGFDQTLEVNEFELKEAENLKYSCDVEALKNCNVYIVTVPTPIDAYKQPDLRPLKSASELLGQVIKPNDVVIYESTVYPGATEEECVPVIEVTSEMSYNNDFFVGYSPERINPGDKKHKVSTIMKVTSGSTPEVAEFVDSLYQTIITAGTHKAESIRVAEASKVIENIQRDVNIALVNEFYQIFENLGIDTNQVIEAAATKWNFMKLKPGLVGGHCIGVDPYYLLHKSQSYGYVPDLMRSAREINDGMSAFIAQQFLRELIKKKINPIGLRVLIMGFSFKENCPDIRNTKIVDLYYELKKMSMDVIIYDPVVDADEVREEYSLDVVSELATEVDVGFLAVPHTQILTDLKNNKFIFQKSYCFDFKKVLK